MTIMSLFLRALDEEAVTTRKMLSRVPADKLDWQPHPKSMTMRSLAIHIAELPSWIRMGFHTDGIDFADSPYEPTVFQNTAALLQIFEKSHVEGRVELVEENTSRLGESWVLRHGDLVLWDADRAGVIRMAISQMIHHRAQLGVYLRLLDIPIPGSYGPSADEQ